MQLLYVDEEYVNTDISTLILTSRELGPFFFCQKMRQMRSMRKEMDGKVFNSRLSWLFALMFDKKYFSLFVP